MRTYIWVIITAIAIGTWLSAEETPNASEPASRPQTLGIDLSLGFSAGDVADNPGLAIKPEFSWDIAGSGFVIGLTDAEFPLLPQAAGGEMAIFEEFGGNLPDSPVNLSFGNYNSFSFEESNPMFGHIYGKVGFAIDDVEIAGIELDVGYVEASEWAGSLFGKLGGGYTFTMGKNASLKLWVDFNIAVLPAASLGDIEGLLEFQLNFEPAYLLISLEPSLIMLDTPHFAFEPSIAIGLSF